MGLQSKILSGFFILVLMLFIAGLWSIYELNSIGSSVQSILDENYKSIHAAKRMKDALEREDSGILLLILGKWEEGRKIINSADSMFNQEIQVAYNNVTIEGEKMHLDSVKSRYAVYKKLWERPIVDTQKEGNIDWYFSKVHTAFLDATQAVEKLISINDENMYKTASNLESRANRAIMPGIIASVAAIIFALLFTYLVHTFIVNPIIEMTYRIKKFEENKTPFDVRVLTRDEIYDLSESIKELTNFVGSEGK
jgi:methyl-accepting chemotaxis protein